MLYLNNNLLDNSDNKIKKDIEPLSSYNSYLFSCPIDEKDNNHNLDSCGVLGFITKVKVLQSDYFARSLLKAYYSQNYNMIDYLDSMYKSYESRCGFRYNVEWVENNPVKLFFKYMDLNPKNYQVNFKKFNIKTMHRLALLCFYNKYFFKWDNEIIEACSKMPKQNIRINEKNVLDYIAGYPLLSVLKQPYMPKSSKNQDVLNILYENLTILNNNDYHKFISSLISNMIRDEKKSLTDIKQASLFDKSKTK